MGRTDTSGEVIKAEAPKRSEIRIIRILILCGLISMLVFLNWFIVPEHVGYAPFFWFLTIGLIFKLAKMMHEWYHYWSISVPEMPRTNKHYTVDFLTTACPGEPKDMIIRTLHAMKAVEYPHTNYLCDEGNDPELKQVCEQLGIIHVTRTIKTDAKAGNINNALRQATGELCVVLDPDHVPVPQFLDRVVAYFDDPIIGYVQSVQAYGNQGESFVALGAAQQTYHFYGPMMMCMNTYGTVQAIGANCIFRRTALDSIGGHAPGLAEDMHTAMQLHAKGWKSIYVPEILTRGLVPSSLSAYYKQQLKWSRGTFDLLFHVFPKLYKNLTWRQKLHYLCIPLYFLFGLINLFDIAIPAFALALAETPWEMNMINFGYYFLPMCGISMMIRLYAQKWLMEKHERGFHLVGGILRVSTWWIFLIGFIYTLFNIKVPYIPTPKEDEPENCFRLNIPNLVVIVISLFIAAYGLMIDWTPYSIFMAAYSLMTAGILGYTVLMSQQKFLLKVKSILKKIPAINLIPKSIDMSTYFLQQGVYSLARNSAIVILIVLSLVFVSFISVEDAEKNDRVVEGTKYSGGFYFGTWLPAERQNIKQLIKAERNMAVKFNLVGLRQNWADENAFPFETMKDLRDHGSIPLIFWHSEDMIAVARYDLYSGIINGDYDMYLKNCAKILREYKEPVFLSFSNLGEDDGQPDLYKRAWHYIYGYFSAHGISNVTWVWCPNNAKELHFYPGDLYVDWIGVNCLNYGENKKSNNWFSFSEIYEPLRNSYNKLKKPVIISGLGSVQGPDQAEWFNEAFDELKEKKFTEIKSVILYSERKGSYTRIGHNIFFYYADFNLFYSTQTAIAMASQEKQFRHQMFVKGPEIAKKDYKSPFFLGRPGNYELLVNNEIIYIRGVAYNPAHDWRDGDLPLTRRQIEKDFRYIKEMGANTIRRYGSGFYDYNILNIAEESDLNVQFGFWFDPKVDFYADSARVQEYIEEVIEKVEKYKDHSAIIAWSLGNESWGLLKHRFAQPYLTKVRQAYVNLIEILAQRVHEIDPTRPVFSCIEHLESQLPGELVSFRDGAPSVDAMGINSYYKEQISKLNEVTWQMDSLRPYLVSEFGPRGYWNVTYNKTRNGSLIEQSDEEKANWYRTQWNQYVLANKGHNIGGFAYCWHDRMEGSYTWFGLTDHEGRLKPAYYALKEEWTKIKGEYFPQFKIEAPYDIKPGETYTYKAVSNINYRDDLQYEWFLMKDEYLDEMDDIDVSSDDRSVSVTVPTEPSDYRLYLFVTDKNGERVTTSSVPVKVRKTIPKIF
jgi:cellulose synthase (UDP-forming)